MRGRNSREPSGVLGDELTLGGFERSIYVETFSSAYLEAVVLIRSEKS